MLAAHAVSVCFAVSFLACFSAGDAQGACRGAGRRSGRAASLLRRPPAPSVGVAAAALSPCAPRHPPLLQLAASQQHRWLVRNDQHRRPPRDLPAGELSPGLLSDRQGAALMRSAACAAWHGALLRRMPGACCAVALPSAMRMPLPHAAMPPPLHLLCRATLKRSRDMRRSARQKKTPFPLTCSRSERGAPERTPSLCPERCQPTPHPELNRTAAPPASHPAQQAGCGPGCIEISDPLPPSLFFRTPPQCCTFLVHGGSPSPAAAPPPLPSQSARAPPAQNCRHPCPLSWSPGPCCTGPGTSLSRYALSACLSSSA